MIDELWKNVVAETIFSPLVLNPWWPKVAFRPLTNERRERIFLRKGEQTAKHDRDKFELDSKPIRNPWYDE